MPARERGGSSNVNQVAGSAEGSCTAAAGQQQGPPCSGSPWRLHAAPARAAARQQSTQQFGASVGSQSGEPAAPPPPGSQAWPPEWPSWAPQPCQASPEALQGTACTPHTGDLPVNVSGGSLEGACTQGEGHQVFRGCSGGSRGAAAAGWRWRYCRRQSPAHPSLRRPWCQVRLLTRWVETKAEQGRRSSFNNACTAGTRHAQEVSGSFAAAAAPSSPVSPPLRCSFSVKPCMWV